MPASVTTKQTNKNFLKNLFKKLEKVDEIECAVGFPRDKVERYGTIMALVQTHRPEILWD
jgi:hypothetical protein